MPSTTLEQKVGPYVVSDDPVRISVDAIHAYLRDSYWAKGIPREVVERAVRGSLCIGAYRADAQVGLARFISDFATFCYVCDVYVLEEHRGQGLARAMLTMARTHPRLQGLRRWNLVTRDAHALYAPLGFTAVAFPDRYMESLIPNVYAKPAT